MQQPDHQPYLQQQRKLTKRRKRQVILFLRLFILVMVFLIIGLTILIIGQAISSGINTLKSTSSQNSSAASATSATSSNGVSVTTITPSPTAAPTITEILPPSALAESYFGPLPVPESIVALTHNEIHALYIGAAAYMDANIEIAKNSEVNAFVIDLKESGSVYFNSTNTLADDIDALENYYNLSTIVQKCHDNNVKVIGRIVCFKDPILAEKKPDRCIKDAAGNVLFFNKEGGNAFVNPYDTRNWDYAIELAIEAVGMGIDEIQFDYVRFPTGGTTTGEKPYYGDPATTPTKAEVINRFLQTARIRIQDEYGVPLSGDVFGIILSSASDGANLGQDWASVGLTGVDSLCPMIYPSHYALGTVLNNQSFDKPDYYPHDVVYNALLMGADESAVLGFSTLRPYLQAFTAGYIGNDSAGNPNWMTYGYDQINAQIKAVHEAGYTEWILWNPLAKYPTGLYDGL